MILASGSAGAELAIDQFFAAHAQRKLSADERMLILKLMEMQRHTQLMYTSCGWFFDDISGIEDGTDHGLRGACAAAGG